MLLHAEQWRDGALDGGNAHIAVLDLATLAPRFVRGIKLTERVGASASTDEPSVAANGGRVRAQNPAIWARMTFRGEVKSF